MSLQNNSLGFSLFELIIGIALLCIILFLSLTHSGFLNRSLVRADLEHLASNVSYLQQIAMTSGMSQTLHINVERNEYSFLNEKIALSSSVQFGCMEGAKGPPSHPIQDINTPTFENNDILLYPDGKMRPGAIYLVDKQRQVCYALTVPIAHTSSLYKYRYNSGYWERI